MYKSQVLRTLQALLLSSFTVFALGFSHIPLLNQHSMSGMEGMSDHSGMPSVQCQILCTTATKSDELTDLLNLRENDDDSLPAIGFDFTISLSALAVAFVVKRLYTLSSWRPPDRVLLCGYYSDSL